VNLDSTLGRAECRPRKHRQRQVDRTSPAKRPDSCKISNDNSAKRPRSAIGINGSIATGLL
jgi:hypothetical protein